MDEDDNARLEAAEYEATVDRDGSLKVKDCVDVLKEFQFLCPLLIEALW